MSRFSSRSPICTMIAAALACVALACEPIGTDPDGTGTGSGGTGSVVPDNDVGPSPDVFTPDTSVDWPPAGFAERDSTVSVSADGGRTAWFDEEVVVEVEPGAFTVATDVTVSRRLIASPDSPVDLIGYVWGPHIPAPTGSEVTITVPRGWIPVSGAEQNTALFSADDAGRLTPLGSATLSVEGDNLVVSGVMVGEIDTIVVAPTTLLQ